MAQAKDYATQRVTDHLSRFQKLAEQFEHRNMDGNFSPNAKPKDNVSTSRVAALS